MTRPNAHVTVNKTTIPGGARLATYKFETRDGDKVESEAVTLTDGDGNELIGQKSSADSVPVVFANDQPPIPITGSPAILNLGKETPVADTAVEILADNPLRSWFIIQNTGLANIRIGPPGVGPNTGLRLVPNGVATFDMLGNYQGAMFAIAETATASVALAMEAVS